MDNNSQPQAELLDQLLALLRAGCEIRLTPQITGLGYINADVLVTPPPSADPQSPLDEWNKLKTGATISIPYRSGMSLYYRPQILQHALESAAMLYVRRPSTSAKSD